MTTRTRVAVFAVAAAIGLVGLAACNVQSNQGTPTPVAQQQQAAVAKTAEVKDLGPVLADDKGFTLYRFDKDTTEPVVSNCDGDCAGAWPPVIVQSEDVTVEGVAKELVSTYARKDGSRQLVIAGHPQYRFAKDTAPGEAKGQGAQGVWFATTPDGGKAGAVAGTGVVSGLGTVVTGPEGKTLYRFDKDSAKPSVSNCDGDCAKAWPPLVVTTDKPTVAGVAPSLVGTVQRKDGSKQLTIAGWPQYYFAKDSKPGEAKGQGAQGVWFATAIDGKKAQENKAIEVTTSTIGNLGVIATDKDGMTLYRFDKDEKGKTNCVGDCAVKWPPALVTSDNFQVQGVDKALVGTITRPDGTKQITIDGYPQYRFSGDKLCGEANGQGVGGTWWATKPDGSRAGK
ncbi:hypothetical protein Lesp02_15480 [Lentzea sp. NBRC 105346]|uniref:SCO0930 family lipoprotein n=1 Tax=Lentzea sp. NBRC 105346 TaxID=3032205 RepID=UPI00249FAE12|nr:SCO0930 family lipoprotein [Lentzea sp. NBRC 105346]GLZ29358.1 hypothetical protein Lesp02_15480 [Lentzea sp. NBRC 105346]